MNRSDNSREDLDAPASEPDIDAVRRFIAKSMAAELEATHSAGHGFAALYDLREQAPAGWAGWTMLDVSDNVRPSYDVRFVKHWSPQRVAERLYAQARLVATSTDVEALLTLAQEYADGPWAERYGWQPEWRRQTPPWLQRDIGDFIDALAAGPDPR